MVYTLHFGAIIYLTLTVAGLGKNSTYFATLLSAAVIMKRAEEVEGRRKLLLEVASIVLRGQCWSVSEIPSSYLWIDSAPLPMNFWLTDRKTIHAAFCLCRESNQPSLPVHTALLHCPGASDAFIFQLLNSETGSGAAPGLLASLSELPCRC